MITFLQVFHFKYELQASEPGMGATISFDDLFGNIVLNETTTMMNGSGSEVVSTTTNFAGIDVTPQAETTKSLAMNLGDFQKWYLCILLTLLQVTIMRKKNTLFLSFKKKSSPFFKKQPLLQLNYCGKMNNLSVENFFYYFLTKTINLFPQNYDQKM